MLDDSESILDDNPNCDAATLAVLFTMFSAASAGKARCIDTRLVNSWFERRKVTGFPAAAGEREFGVRPARVWNVEEALAWFKNWTPGRPGAPKGNQNALRDGSCVGLRAAREARAAARVG